MTTLIDRIIIKYFDVPNETLITNWEKLRQILEAELTAVKGVDELVKKYTKIKTRLSLHPLIWISHLDGFIEDLQALKQTPVASDEDWCEITPGYYKDEHWDIIIPSRDKPSYDSQPKEVKKYKEKSVYDAFRVIPKYE